MTPLRPLAVVAALVSACAGPAGDDGVDGKDGAAGVDGEDGIDGVDGDDCTVVDGPGVGEHTVTCGDASVVVRDGEDAGEGEGEGEGEAPCVVVEGNVTVVNSLDVAALADVCEIEGDLLLRAPGLTEVTLPRLQRLSGNLGADGQGTLTRVSLPALTEAGNVSVDEMAGAGVLDLPLLADVEGEVFIEPALNATTLALPSLAHVGGALRVQSVLNGGPTSALTTLSLPALATVGGAVGISALFELTSLDVTALETVGDSLTVQGVGVDALSFPALTTASGLVIADNPALTTLSMPLVNDQLGNLNIVNNAQLTTCVGAAIEGFGDCAP